MTGHKNIDDATIEIERRKARERLDMLTFDHDDVDSHHNLAAIADAVWGAAPVAWTRESCVLLAKRLAWLIGGEHG